MKKKVSFKRVLFFLIGAFTYSFFYWATAHNYVQVFGMILIAVACYIIYLIDIRRISGREWIRPTHVICMCAGAIFDSLSSAFPFGFIPL